MTRNVGQSLLGDAIDGQLHVRCELRLLSGKVPLELEACLLCEACRERLQRADQPEVLQQFRSKLLRDPPHLLDALAGRLLRLREHFTPGRGDFAGDPLEQEQHAGHALADLVVQLGRDPLPLGLLCRERTPAALAPLQLQALEHLVERQHQVETSGEPAGVSRRPGRSRSTFLIRSASRSSGLNAGRNIT